MYNEVPNESECKGRNETKIDTMKSASMMSEGGSRLSITTRGKMLSDIDETKQNASPNRVRVWVKIKITNDNGRQTWGLIDELFNLFGKKMIETRSGRTFANSTI